MDDLDGTLRHEWVKCGKAACKRCTGLGHGPYWYLYYRTKGRLKKTYIGKHLPREYDHNLHSQHDGIAYERYDSLWCAACVGARGYLGPDGEQARQEAGITKLLPTYENKKRLAGQRCSRCETPFIVV